MKFPLNPSKIGMDQIIKLTTQMATTAITQIMIEKIIASAKSLHEDDEFDFDTFFTAENINQVITMEKMKIAEARKILNINTGKKTKKDPNKPKKFNGYLLFCNEERVKLKEEDEFKDAEFVDIAKELGSRWRSLTEDEKHDWKEKAIERNSLEVKKPDTPKKTIVKKTTKKKKKTTKKKKKTTKKKKKKKKKLPVIDEESSDEDFSSDSDMSDSDMSDEGFSSDSDMSDEE